MAILDVQNLTFYYPDCEVPALSGVNFQVEAGEFVVICGRSGCGKSTLIRHFKTVLSPHGRQEGEILYRGKPLHQVDLRTQAERIGYVMQNPDQQIVTDKVWHELAFGLENLGLDLPTMHLRVAEMASYFGIQTWFDKDVSQLSGGQRQTLNLASVMAMHPEILVLDEPTSQLDPIAATEFLHTVKRLNEQMGITVLVIEHRLDEVFPMADRVLAMEDGKILSYDTPKQVGHQLGNHPLSVCFPAPVQIYAQVEGEGVCPLTVKEGRTWLESYQDKPAKGERLPVAETPVQPQAPALEAREVWFRYERNGVDVIQGLNLEVQPGCIFALMGGNGEGKSTTLALFSGIQKAYRGQIRVNGKEIGKYKKGQLYQALLGVLPQNPQCLFVKDTVEEDLEELLGQLPLSAQEKQQRKARVIRDTDIGHLLGQHPYDLSGGEQQRAALAKVLLLEPKVLLLDEPTKGLDGCYKGTLAQVLKGLRDQGHTIVMVSHDVEFCASHADACALFFKGRVVTQRPAKEFFLDNHFYTTAANQMAREVFPQAVTIEDVVNECKIRR